MSVKFLSNNLAETAITVVGSTENAQFPATNIVQDFRTKVFRSTTNSDNVVFDLGSIEPVDYFSFVTNWQDGFGFSTIKIQGNATDSWGAPSFDSGSITFDSTHEFGIKSFTEESLRFWRVVMTSTLGYCELSNVFIGKATSIATNGISFGYSHKNLDVRTFKSSRYGQEFIDDVTQRKELNGLKIRVMNTTEVDTFFEIFDNRRTVKPMFIEFCQTSGTPLNNNNRLSGIYKFVKEPSVKNTTAGFWDTTFNLREQK